MAGIVPSTNGNEQLKTDPKPDLLTHDKAKTLPEPVVKITSLKDYNADEKHGLS